MNRVTNRFALITLAGLAMACSGSNESQPSSETTASEVGREVGEAAEAAAEMVTDTVEEYRRIVRDELDEIDRNIEELKRTAEQKGDEAGAKANEALQRLDEQRQAIARELERLTSSGGEALGETRDGIDRAITDLKDAYEKAKGELERS